MRKFSTCWVVTDGKAGMESQCLGLAEALELTPLVKRVNLREPWRSLSPYLTLGLGHAFSQRDTLARPWPDILIATGRLSVPASLYVRRQSRKDGQSTFTVQIQDPVISPDNFDLVIAPMHDALKGANVITTIGALHRVTPDKLAREADIAAFPTFSPPRIGVLVGGANAAYAFGEDEAKGLGSQLRELGRRMGASLLVTPSRRTGEGNIAALRSGLAGTRSFVWDGTGENPYFGILGLSDFLIVTADSVNMISEACASGKPVYIYDLPGGSRKSRRFLDALLARGLVRRFSVPLEPFRGATLNEMDTVVKAIGARLA